MFNYLHNSLKNFCSSLQNMHKNGAWFAIVRNPYVYLISVISFATIIGLAYWIHPLFSVPVEEVIPIKNAHANTKQLYKEITTASVTRYHAIDNLKQKQRISHWIAKRYRLPHEEINRYVTSAYNTAIEVGLDPHMILAVMAIESRFNPTARSNKGAEGLMQILTRMHQDKFALYGGVNRAFDPEINIKVGSQILKDYIIKTDSVEEALKHYVGAATLNHDGGYGNKVLDEYRFLKQVASGKHVPTLVRSRNTNHSNTVAPHLNNVNITLRKKTSSI